MSKYTFMTLRQCPQLKEKAAYGWEFLCMVQGEGEPEMSRMYIHR